MICPAFGAPSAAPRGIGGASPDLPQRVPLGEAIVRPAGPSARGPHPSVAIGIVRNSAVLAIAFVALRSSRDGDRDGSVHAIAQVTRGAYERLPIVHLASVLNEHEDDRFARGKQARCDAHKRRPAFSATRGAGWYWHRRACSRSGRDSNPASLMRAMRRRTPRQKPRGAGQPSLLSSSVGQRARRDSNGRMEST